jgi:nucleoside-diphosphate-sugar epimerase
MHQRPTKPLRHVIITGGAGFIGSQISVRLIKGKTRVTILTRHVSAPRATALAQQGCKVVACDLADAHRIPRPNTLDPADALFHFAADVSVSSPTLQAANVDGTSRALALADTLAIPYVVYASSIEAQGLGSDNEIPLREDIACRPVSDYGKSKVQAEALVTAWGALPGHRALVLRIGNIYGPGSAWFLHPCWPCWAPRRFGLSGRSSDIVCFSRSSSTTSSKVFVEPSTTGLPARTTLQGRSRSRSKATWPNSRASRN